MRRKFTTLLLISLMLALPLRAVAGLAMFGCAPNHHSASFMSHDHSGEAPMHEMSGCHHGEQAPSGAQENCHQDHGAGTKHVASTCSTCGDCCTGAMSGSVVSQPTPPQQSKSVLIVFLDRTYVGHHPEGPEHPPRSALS